MNINIWPPETDSSPILDFIEAQEAKASARIMRDIDHLEQQGLNLLRTNKVKQLTGYSNLYELIVTFKGVGYRVIFTVANREVWLLVAFKKKSNSTPRRHINNALRRQALLQPA